MLINASHAVTKISENEEVNASNYFESLAFINNLYNFINKIKLVVSCKDFIFIPTFKGINTCQRFGIDSLESENEMKRFIIKSELFLEDEVRENIRDIMGNMCNSIIFVNNKIEFILK